ncbi:ABC transporter substrate-binding protein, partial [bacterium]|nr:ABC transporter substrate-binding protein [bacterium]
ALKLSVLPSDLEARKLPELQTDPVMLKSTEQIAKGRLMPIVPEMRAIWDTMRPGYQSVMNGDLTPAEAARSMQNRAVTMIERMRE